jgi:hypothetical protein
MHAFILGVPGRYRGAALESELAATGIGFEVVAGPDASCWTGDDITRVYSPKAAQIVRHRQLAPAEVACSLGHQSMIRTLARRGDPWGLLLEDDARLVQPLLPVLTGLSHLPDEPIVIQLGSRRPAIPSNTPLELEGNRLWRQPKPVFGSFAYLMNKRAALIADKAYRRRRVDSVADWPFCWSEDVQFWRTAIDIARPDSDAESLIKASRRSVLTASSQSRSAAFNAAIGLLQISGAAAIYGACHGLPIRRLYQRDRAEGILRLRRRYGQPAVGLRERP